MIDGPALVLKSLYIENKGFRNQKQVQISDNCRFGLFEPRDYAPLEFSVSLTPSRKAFTSRARAGDNSLMLFAFGKETSVKKRLFLFLAYGRCPALL